MADATGWESLGPAQLKPDKGEALNLVLLEQVEQQGGLRLAKRDRPYRPGAKQDDTGRKAREFSLEFIFHNEIDEETSGPPMWPDRANAFEALLEQSQVTHTLHLPWRRNIRVKCESYTRTASTDRYDGETFSVTFHEDNEDDQAAATEFVTVKSLKQAVDRAIFAAESEGIWNPALEPAVFTDEASGFTGSGLEDIQTLAANLEAWINAPGEYHEGIAMRARVLQGACFRVIDALSTQVEGSNQLGGPGGARLYDALIEIIDVAGGALAEATSHFPPTRTVTFGRDRSIGDIAVEFKQSVRDLISVNGDLDDPEYIPAGTPVQVFA